MPVKKQGKRYVKVKGSKKKYWFTWWETKGVLGVEKRSQPVAVCTNEFLGSIR